ncbi:MAG: hypothetical protein AAGG01_08340 [Planctomycetota bacterium]
MNHVSLLGGISFAALLLPLSGASSTFSGGGETAAPEYAAKVSSLVEAVVADLKTDKVYECQCDKGEDAPDVCPTTTSPAAKFTKMLSYADPGVMKLVEPLAVDAVRSKGIDEDDAHAFIGMFLESRSATVLPVAEAMHSAAPAKFTPRHLLGFCEMGSDELKISLAKQVSKGKGDVECAAYFALRGEKVGAKALKAALKADVTTETALDVLIAGFALEHLGKKGAKLHSQQAVHTAALTALDAGDLKSARAFAIAATVANTAGRTSAPVLSLMDLRCHELGAMAEKKGKLSSADQIFEKIEEALPVL